MRLFSYCIPIDDGAAPNPFWGICTLAICKPAIRRTAQIGDWIVGTGSAHFGFLNKVIYSMKITDIKTFREYDSYCKINLPNKIPDCTSSDNRRKVGDCIYDFPGQIGPKLREGVHEEINMERDLGGRNVLLSDEFYYFGYEPIPLPTRLLNIVKQGQGHKSCSNDPYINDFVKWIEKFNDFKNKINALPYGLKDYTGMGCKKRCSRIHLVNDEEDEKLEALKCK